MFVKTDTILDKILAAKAAHVAELKPRAAELRALAETSSSTRDFIGALHKPNVALIAEVKKASPSKGVLAENFDPVALAQTYAENGASAISVLTDTPFFQGEIEHLRQVRAVVDVPIMRKDFMIDPIQIDEARGAGADAILLIVMALDDTQLADLYAYATGIGLSAFVEVHNADECERALKIGAALIGVNNRDLRTFHEDLGTVSRVASMIPEGVTLVAESAIRSAGDVRRMGELGASAVLVGEGLIKSDDIAAQVQAFSSQPKKDVR